MLPTRGLAAIFGSSGSGKSFLGIDLAGHIAGGERWFDCRVMARPVVYLVLEGEGGVRQRVQAWQKHNSRALPDSMGVIVQPFTLTEAQDLADLAAVVPAGAVTFLDTLNRAAPVADENSSRDMGQILQAAKQLQAITKGLVVLVHHTGKNEEAGLRGHSSLIAALDASVKVTRDGDTRTWAVQKVKDGRDGQAHGFVLEVVTLQIDAHGDPETSCIIRPVTAPARKPLSSSLQLALNAFHEADDLALCVHLDDWRAALYRRMSDAKDDAKRQAMRRAALDLVNLGELKRDGDYFSAPSF